MQFGRLGVRLTSNVSLRPYPPSLAAIFAAVLCWKTNISWGWGAVSAHLQKIGSDDWGSESGHQLNHLEQNQHTVL